MGYSCTKAASDSLAVLSDRFKTDGNPNYLTIRGDKYFFERGREQADGSITGELMQFSPDENTCTVAGRVKIAPNGVIVRFPRVTVKETIEIENEVRRMLAADPRKLNSLGVPL